MQPTTGQVKRKHAWMKFFPGDWMKDPEVGLLKPATRGIWFDAICAMHELDQCGQLIGTVSDLARNCRCTPNELRVALDDLKSRNAADVTERNGVVTLVNRRMRREWTGRKSSRERVMRYRHRKRNADVTPDVTPVLPGESICQKSTSTTGPPAAGVDVDDVVEGLERQEAEETEGERLLASVGFSRARAAALAAEYDLGQIQVAVTNARWKMDRGQIRETPTGFVLGQLKNGAVLLAEIGRTEMKDRRAAEAKAEADRRAVDLAEERRRAAAEESAANSALDSLSDVELEDLKRTVIAADVGPVRAVSEKADPKTSKGLRRRMYAHLLVSRQGSNRNGH